MRLFNPLEEKNIKILTSENIEISFLMPTATGLQKSIMDATAPFRLFLYERGIHDYGTQGQGIEYKKLIQSHIATEDGFISSQTSLYRPVTKKGDPRIWFSGLKKYADPNDMLGIFEFGMELYVFNLTKFDIEQILNVTNPLTDLIRSISQDANKVAQELLLKIKTIAARGHIQAIGTGDTAIGRTLESLIGIPMNSRQEPDYKGIELKSFRDKRGNRKTLFAKVPDWNLSKFKSSAEILNQFGYKRGDDFKLYCTVSTLKPNSQGLFLRIDEKLDQLVESSQELKIGDFAIWQLATLHDELKKKHKETFWIAADSSKINEVEYFCFTKIEHTRSPIVSQFDLLLEQGIITLDHLIKKTSNGKTNKERVSEKGPLFKIKPDKLELLFPPSVKYSLR
ncbi:MvaI/BcnI family restriction endonuclease [Pseudanabaena sp. Chao 1811]|uniref:MvaI/BcnI family restriction endonuclease n=1 Tax=Pseudanabaena sp. Chao 1811 TaxID=2963092 RepID=UPI0022F3BD36|nr:MvaI/BcnI family restriction endonuclease [Pseudanabaena sp. Chao 1811]